jgi:hypothetical protein
MTLRLALRSHPSRQFSSPARRPPPEGYDRAAARAWHYITDSCC